MCELTLEQAGLSVSDIATTPTRKTWYGIVGNADACLTPECLTDDPALAKARAVVANHDFPASGPWHVVTLTENLRVPQ